MNKKGKRLRGQLKIRQRAAQLALWVVVPFTGCSTFEIDEGYVAPDQSSTIKIPANNAHITAGFIPETRFGSFGVLGVPAIPVYATNPHSNELQFRIALGFTEEHAFSLPKSICLKIALGEDLCSNKVVFRASAMRHDNTSPSGWRSLAGMGLNNPFLEIVPSALADTHEIDQGLVYSTYGYRGYPGWNVLSVDIVYTFDCTDACPRQFRLHNDHLVSIDNGPIAPPPVEFHRAKIKNYTFATDPGP
jgi:hypothetical protein